MKRFGLLLLLMYIVGSKKVPKRLVDSWINMVKPFQEVCSKRFGISSELARDVLINANPPNERSYKCYGSCTFGELGYLTPHGRFDITVLMEKAPFILQEVIQGCVSEGASEDDLCEKAYKNLNCLMQGMAED
ncbi:hypothetical protein RI129_012863 [Pyrocoelia pectoralis]|uniref:Uncharacterized protein n=1 Tax=Pyrocoelia pectoralis TaxID=417401 RepID=A0AAN7V3C7_9COLE